MRGIVILGTMLGAMVLAGCSVFGGKAAEEPAYAVERLAGDNEIRAYEGYAVARVREPGGRDEATREGFLRLFDYISGENQAGGEIAMTAPVLTEPGSAKGGEGGTEIAMTAPVLSEAAGDGWVVAFVLPEGMDAAAAPVPADPGVEIVDVPGERVAVRRFAGFLTAEKAAANRARLDEWLAAEGIAHKGDWRTAGFHPPWTIPWLRRYEVWVSLD